MPGCRICPRIGSVRTVHANKLKSLFVCSVLMAACFILVYYYVLTDNPLDASPAKTSRITSLRQIKKKIRTTKILKVTNITEWSVNLTDNAEYRKTIYDKFYKAANVSAKTECDRIINGEAKAINEANKALKGVQRKPTNINLYTNISNCETFKTRQGYISHPLSFTERDFPLAFGIVVYKDVEQAERLLKAIYRPHNFYCFHVDKKADSVTRTAFENIASCFGNVFVVPDPVDVQWGKFTLLQAELLCMEQLWNETSWKYYINLTGQEFPLKTNLEIVKILQAMEGANIAQAMQYRTMTEFKNRWKPVGNPPHNITPVVGSVHAALNRDFVDFSLHDNRSLDFQKYLLNTTNPDELFFSSLNHNPHLRIPGSFTGEAEEYPKKPFFLRYKNWTPAAGIYPRRCYGKILRDICILGIGDIHKAVNDIGLFANKFHLDFEPLGLECLESWLNERTWKQYLSNETIDVSYYKQLDQVKFQYRPGQQYNSAYS